MHVNICIHICNFTRVILHTHQHHPAWLVVSVYDMSPVNYNPFSFKNANAKMQIVHANWGCGLKTSGYENERKPTLGTSKIIHALLKSCRKHQYAEKEGPCTFLKSGLNFNFRNVKSHRTTGTLKVKLDQIEKDIAKAIHTECSFFGSSFYSKGY